MIVAGACVHVGADVGILGLLKFAVILSEGRVAQYRLEEVAADRQSSARALSQCSCAEVDAAILAAHPGASNQMRAYSHKPCIAVIV